MKPLFYGLLLAMVPFCLFAQDHQTNKKTLSRHLREVYDVLKTDWKTKDGSYAVINDDGQTIVRGAYTKGRKSGVWSYFDYNGRLVQRFDFSDDSLVYQDRDSLSVVHNDFQIPGIVDDSAKVGAPYKIGGPEYGFYLLYDERDIPAEVRSATSTAQMTFILTISEKGALEAYRIVFSGGGFNDITIPRSVKGLPREACEFAAATLDGHPVRSQISWMIPLNISHFDHPGTNYFPTQKTSSN
jgi:hypothetical protein